MDCNKKIMDRIREHKNDALNSISTDWFVICGQGSINYPGLFDKESDIDSKMLTLPSLKDIVCNKKTLNHVHIMPNEEHVDMKDVRDYFKIFRKQNINFTEILFTDYWISNSTYTDLWMELRCHAEDFIRMNPYRTLKCCKGMIFEKAHALEHRYPSRAYYIDTFGYDGKQLQHALRVLEFAEKFVKNYSYKDCLTVANPEYLLAIKRHKANLDLESAKKLMDYATNSITTLEANWNNIWKDKENTEAKELLDDILYRLIVRSIKVQIEEKT